MQFYLYRHSGIPGSRITRMPRAKRESQARTYLGYAFTDARRLALNLIQTQHPECSVTHFPAGKECYAWLVTTPDGSPVEMFVLSK